VANSFEHFNKPLGSIKGEEFHEKVKDYWLPKRIPHGTNCLVPYKSTWGLRATAGVTALRVAYRCRRLTQFSHALSYEVSTVIRVTELL
jgi:hypothetical protein